MQPNPLGLRMFTYSSLFRGSKDLTNNIDTFAGNLEMFISHRMWETGWWDEPSEKMRFAPSLSEFITRDYPDGIGRSVEWVYAGLASFSKINKAAKAALELFTKAIEAEGGKPPAQAFEMAAMNDENMPPAKPAGRPPGGEANVDNVNINPGGNSSTYIVARLKRDAPELAQRVVRGEVSPHAAAVQAGIRRPTWTAPAEPERLAAAIERRFPGWKLVRVA